MRIAGRSAPSRLGQLPSSAIGTSSRPTSEGGRKTMLKSRFATVGFYFGPITQTKVPNIPNRKLTPRVMSQKRGNRTLEGANR